MDNKYFVCRPLLAAFSLEQCKTNRKAALSKRPGKEQYGYKGSTKAQIPECAVCTLYNKPHKTYSVQEISEGAHREELAKLKDKRTLIARGQPFTTALLEVEKWSD